MTPADDCTTYSSVSTDRTGPTRTFLNVGVGDCWTNAATDYLTRYAETKALPFGTSTEIAKFFKRSIVLRHGASEVLITDRGSAFMAQLT